MYIMAKFQVSGVQGHSSYWTERKKNNVCGGWHKTLKECVLAFASWILGNLPFRIFLPPDSFFSLSLFLLIFVKQVMCIISFYLAICGTNSKPTGFGAEVQREENGRHATSYLCDSRGGSALLVKWEKESVLHHQRREWCWQGKMAHSYSD